MIVTCRLVDKERIGGNIAVSPYLASARTIETSALVTESIGELEGWGRRTFTEDCSLVRPSHYYVVEPVAFNAAECSMDARTLRRIVINYRVVNDGSWRIGRVDAPSQNCTISFDQIVNNHGGREVDYIKSSALAGSIIADNIISDGGRARSKEGDSPAKVP